MTSRGYKFGTFRLDPAARRLWRDGEEVVLPVKAFDCIVYLVEHRERAVGRDELISAVWGNADVSDSVLGQSVLHARRALDDTGQAQHVIRTVPRFGYQWVARVDEVSEPVAGSERPLEERSAPARSRRRSYSNAAVAVAVAVSLAWFWWSNRDDPMLEVSASEAGMLVLPVTVAADSEFSWVRLGVMDLIAERLRAAGAPVLPSDNTMALLGEADALEDPDAIVELASTARVGLVLEAEARLERDRWAVALSTRHGREPRATVTGRAEDVLDAAREAGDQMAMLLGLTPSVDDTPAGNGGLETLQRKMEVALRLEQLDVARDLLARATPKLKQSPELRLLEAQIEFQSGRLENARTLYQNLVATVPDTELVYARSLHALGVIALSHGDYAAARARFDAAIEHFGPEHASSLGKSLTSRAVSYALRGDYSRALDDFSRARAALESVRDDLGLAVVDSNLGALNMARDRYVEALPVLERAAARLAAFNAHSSEMGARNNIARVNLMMLDPAAALAVDARLNELVEAVPTANAHGVALVRAEVYLANGRMRDARAALAEALQAEIADPAIRADLELFQAEFALEEGRTSDIRRHAQAALAMLARDNRPRAWGRAWWLNAHVDLLQDREDAVGAELVRAEHWPERGQWPILSLFVELARAQLATATGDDETAGVAFEQALALAERQRVPLDLLYVIEAYTDYLVERGRAEQAGVLIQRLSGWAEQEFRVALLQTRVYHALGQAEAWRVALARAQALAGERVIAGDLLVES